VQASDFEEWNYDGSSTNQAPGHDSEVIIKPRAVFRYAALAAMQSLLCAVPAGG
jgi:hypothetical protein